MEWLISLLCGAVGGNLGGMILKKFSLGTLGNSIVGILGGGVGNAALTSLGMGGGGILNQIAGGGVGGIVLMVIVALIKKAFGK